MTILLLGGKFVCVARKLRVESEAELMRRRKSDSRKVAVARRLRQETTMTLCWIAQRLNMGAAGSLANLVRGAKRR